MNQILILIPRYCKIRWYWGVIGIARIRLLILLLKLILHIWRIWFSYQYWYCKISWTTIDIGIDVANPLLLLLILILVLQPRVIEYWYWYRDPVSTIAQPWYRLWSRLTKSTLNKAVAHWISGDKRAKAHKTINNYEHVFRTYALLQNQLQSNTSCLFLSTAEFWWSDCLFVNRGCCNVCAGLN